MPIMHLRSVCGRHALPYGLRGPSSRHDAFYAGPRGAQDVVWVSKDKQEVAGRLMESPIEKRMTTYQVEAEFEPSPR